MCDYKIVPELQEMLNKLELFCKNANTHYASATPSLWESPPRRWRDRRVGLTRKAKSPSPWERVGVRVVP